MDNTVMCQDMHQSFIYCTKFVENEPDNQGSSAALQVIWFELVHLVGWVTLSEEIPKVYGRQYGSNQRCWVVEFEVTLLIWKPLHK